MMVGSDQIGSDFPSFHPSARKNPLPPVPACLSPAPLVLTFDHAVATAGSMLFSKILTLSAAGVAYGALHEVWLVHLLPCTPRYSLREAGGFSSRIERLISGKLGIMFPTPLPIPTTNSNDGSSESTEPGVRPAPCLSASHSGANGFLRYFFFTV